MEEYQIQISFKNQEQGVCDKIFVERSNYKTLFIKPIFLGYSTLGKF